MIFIDSLFGWRSFSSFETKMAECPEDPKKEKEKCKKSPPASPGPSSLKPPEPRLPLEGGFPVELVKTPTELQYECPVCLQILCEPHQVTCCGYSFCKSCITRMRNNGQPCPMCKEPEYEVFADKRLRRSLYAYHVKCSNQQEGCEWVGELGELVRHLNEEPLDKTRLDGCKFIEVKCQYCEENLVRKDIQEHESSCIFRPYTCEYCKTYKNTQHDVTVNHWPVCPNMPVECSNKCGAFPERRNLKQHEQNECPEAILKCPFAYIGCEAQLPAADMPEHVQDNLIQHIQSMASNQQQMMKQLEKMQLMLERRDDQIAELVREREGLRGKMSEQLETIQNLRRDLGRVRSKQEYNKKAIQNLQEHSAIAPIIFTLDDFEGRLRRKDMGWHPAPFYTHAQGYKMLLCVDVYGNGTGKGTHMSVFLSLLKGEFDEQLRWPFRASITIRLENQEEEDNHYEEVIKYHESTPEVTAGRIMEEGRQGRPWGKGKFIAHNDLYGKYLSEDCLRIGVSKVELHY